MLGTLTFLTFIFFVVRIQLRIERWVVIHFVLPVNFVAGMSGRTVGEQGIKTIGKIAALIIESREFFSAGGKMYGISVGAHSLRAHRVDL